MNVQQLLMLGLEAVVMIAILLALFRARSVLGLTPLYVVTGGFQYLEATVSMKVQVMPGVLVNPASAVFFTATLLTVLLVYIKEDTLEARKLVYGVVLANAALSLASLMLGWQVTLPGSSCAAAANFVVIELTPGTTSYNFKVCARPVTTVTTAQPGVILRSGTYPSSFTIQP